MFLVNLNFRLYFCPPPSAFHYTSFCGCVLIIRMLCNYFHSILFPYSKTVIVNGSYHVTKYYNMIGPHVVCLCVTCSSMRIKGGRTGEGTGRGWHGTPRRFLRGVSASTCFTAAGALFRHSWLIKEESASWSLHWLASKLKMSGNLCL